MENVGVPFVKTVLSLLIFFHGISFADRAEQTLSELRSFSEGKRIDEYGRLSDEKKIELFYVANSLHPPYFGLNSAIAGQDIEFIKKLRLSIDERGGTPEVLDFLSILLLMKQRHAFNAGDISELRLESICSKAKLSTYCPNLLREVIN